MPQATDDGVGDMRLLLEHAPATPPPRKSHWSPARDIPFRATKLTYLSTLFHPIILAKYSLRVRYTKLWIKTSGGISDRKLYTNKHKLKITLTLKI